VDVVALTVVRRTAVCSCRLRLSDGGKLTSRSVVITAGVTGRRLGVPAPAVPREGSGINAAVFGDAEIQLRMVAAMICRGVWPAGLARAASKAAWVRPARAASRVWLYPAGWTGGRNTPI